MGSNQPMNKMILEVRAGTGGDEAGLFASDLARMYQRYAGTRGWSFRVIDSSENAQGGYKTLIAEIAGEGDFGNQGLVATLGIFTGVDDSETPAASPGVPLVHSSQITGKETSFVAASAGPDF